MKDVVCVVVFLLRGDEILLAMKQRGIGKGYWNGPGGKVEPGETIEQAMVRECQEEIEVTPTVYDEVAYHDFVLRNKEASWHQWTHVYLATDWHGEPRPSEEMLPQWFKLESIPYSQMWPDDESWLPLVLSGKKLRTEYHLAPDYKVEKQHIIVVKELNNV